MNADYLFGAPTRYDPVTRQRWIRLLTNCWLDLMDRLPKGLDLDLEALRPFFGNGASAKTIKPRIYAMRDADPETGVLPAEVALVVDGCVLITPEGRILLDVLLQLERIGTWEIGVEQQLMALSASSTVRSAWHAKWLNKQFNSNISPAALGAALFLLVNGSIGERRALELPSDGQRDRELGEAVMPLIADFSEDLGKPRPSTDEGVRQHWAFTQVTRLLGRDVAREKTEQGSELFVRPGREKDLLNRLHSLLDDVGVDDSRRHMAVMNFVEGYRRSRGRLAALGQMHEDPTETSRITQRLTTPGGRT